MSEEADRLSLFTRPGKGWRGDLEGFVRQRKGSLGRGGDGPAGSSALPAPHRRGRGAGLAARPAAAAGAQVGTVRRRRPRGRGLDESRRCSSGAPARSELLPQLTCRGWRKVPSSSRGAGCGGRGRRSRRPRSEGRLAAGRRGAQASSPARPGGRRPVGGRGGRQSRPGAGPIGARRDGRGGAAVEPGERESTDTQGARSRLPAGGGRRHRGIWGGLAQVYPEAAEQRGWTPRILNVLAAAADADPLEAARLQRTFPLCRDRGRAPRVRLGAHDHVLSLPPSPAPAHQRDRVPLRRGVADHRGETRQAGVSWKTRLLAESWTRRRCWPR